MTGAMQKRRLLMTEEEIKSLEESANSGYTVVFNEGINLVELTLRRGQETHTPLPAVKVEPEDGKLEMAVESVTTEPTVE